MGTRADFYIGKGKESEWLGSIAWDGYPDAIAQAVKDAKSADEFRAAVAEFFAGRDDVTLPADGWPWPWNDSETTDYAYSFFDGGVKASCFGNNWFEPARAEAMEDEESREEYEESGIGFKPDFPDMSGRKAVASGSRSGLIVIGG
jgi:hypothetical protein